jgi:GNAT superfamily N-acetyltransferase
MSLYSQYLAEREDKQVLENEFGFVTYKIINDNECYIQDIYVVPEMRKEGLSFKMRDQVIELAKNMGCKTLIGSVSLDANDASRNLKIMLNDNWQVHGIAGNTLFLNKPIDGVV